MTALAEHELKARMPNPVMIVPGAFQALQSLKAATDKCGVPATTFALIELRASQINSCSVCLDGHFRAAKRMGETDERLATVAAWRHAPYFTDAERATLALTEALTRLSDRPDAVPDAIWEEIAQHYDEKALAAIVLAIAHINVWNRVNVAVGQVSGEWKGE